VEWAVDDEEGEAVDCGPGKVLGVGAAARGEEAVKDHEVEGVGEQLEGVETAGACLGFIGVVGDWLGI